MTPTPFSFTALYILGFILANVGANLCSKYVSMKSGSTLLWWYLGGNLIGFWCTIFMPLALKGGHPNIIYALCLGGTFCVLQIASYLIFREPLSIWQLCGIGLVALGSILLQIKA